MQDEQQPPDTSAPEALRARVADLERENAELRSRLSRGALRKSEERLRFALASARMGTWEWNVQSGEVSWSDEVEAIFGLPPGSFDHSYAGYLALVHPEDRDDVETLVQRTLNGMAGDDYHVEHRTQRPDGQAVWLEAFGRVYRDPAGAPLRMAGTVTEITTRKALETQLETAQRMETVGRLAGGIAHDFNNLLTAIMGCIEVARLGPDLPGHVSEALDSIQDASERAARLTAQLLTFARKRLFSPQTVDLGALMHGMQVLLERLTGDRVKLALQQPSRPVPVRADPAQLEQILMNLIVNARDAMPAGGNLDVLLDATDIAPADDSGLAPGRYARMRVRDTGHGIAPGLLPRIFDPFFTTKSDGNGLGLSTCYGIVKQLGGMIQASSQPEIGSCFTVLIPTIEAPSGVLGDGDETRPLELKGRILLVEDDAMVRTATERGLRARGFEVLVAEDGQAALRLVADGLGSIDLLISDVVMPGMNGFELAESLRRRRADLSVLFVSGYAEQLANDSDMRPTQAAYLKKPYTISELSQRAATLIEAHG